MTYHHISYETIDDAIAVVTLSRPERLNALHGPMMEELTQAIGRIEGDDHIRAFILTGRPRSDGRPCFSAGVDIKATLEGNTIGTGIGFNLTNQIDDMLKPSIAVIDGVCSTGAVELALACDLRLVGEQAQISDWHLKNLGTGLGGWGASTRWSRLVGVARTKEIVLTGKVVDAAEAYRIGFATASYPSDRLMDEALSMARTMVSMKREGVRLTLAHLDRNQDMGRDQALRWAELLKERFDVTSDFGQAGKNLERGKAQSESSS